MPYDTELAEAFFIALEGKHPPYIENAYNQYHGYIRNLDALDLHIDYDWHLEKRVREEYRRWKLENDDLK